MKLYNVIVGKHPKDVARLVDLANSAAGYRASGSLLHVPLEDGLYFVQSVTRTPLSAFWHWIRPSRSAAQYVLAIERHNERANA